MAKKPASKDDNVRVAIKRFLEEKPKATLRSMKKIMSEFNGTPSLVIEDENGVKSTDYEAFEKMLYIGAQQIDHSLTEDALETIQDIIDMDSLQDAMAAVMDFMRMTISPAVIPQGMETSAEESDPASEEKPEDEGDESKNVP